jgi:predicted O-methyltransferase YrrM
MNLTDNDLSLIFRQVVRRVSGNDAPDNALAAALPALRSAGTIEEVMALCFDHPLVARWLEISTTFPNGHFYSPVVDPSAVSEYHKESLASTSTDMHGIDIDVPRMAELWQDMSATINATPFEEQPSENHRYGYLSSSYQYGDGILLRAMIHHFRPKRIIEVGSGSSTACMLDTFDELPDPSPALTSIDPYPQRLIENIGAEGLETIRLIPQPVQEVSLDVFDELAANDILFIDSTHVLKTGSDVHYEFFKVFPRLAPGVLIHLHDCAFPFEYNPVFTLERNYSWNEIYAVRALLMDSRRYEVVMSGSCLAREKRPLIDQITVPFLKNPGSALWLRVREG